MIKLTASNAHDQAFSVLVNLLELACKLLPYILVLWTKQEIS